MVSCGATLSTKSVDELLSFFFVDLFTTPVFIASHLGILGNPSTIVVAWKHFQTKVIIDLLDSKHDKVENIRLETKHTDREFKLFESFFWLI